MKKLTIKFEYTEAATQNVLAPFPYRRYEPVNSFDKTGIQLCADAIISIFERTPCWVKVSNYPRPGWLCAQVIHDELLDPEVYPDQIRGVRVDCTTYSTSTQQDKLLTKHCPNNLVYFTASEETIDA